MIGTRPSRARVTERRGRVYAGNRTGAARLLPLYAAYAAMAAITWRRSGDPIIDWGRELLVAWYVSEGWGVPVDVALLFGPLSPHINGLLFRAFGTSITTLLVANLIVLAVAATCVWLISRNLFGPSTAELSCLAFLFLSGFPHLLLDGNYNFITPYSHGATHGATLGLMMIAVLIARWPRRVAPLKWCLGGILCGLAVLTKPEVGVATVAALIAALLLPEKDTARRVRPVLLSLLGLAVAFAATSALIFPDDSLPEIVETIVAPYRTATLPAARSNRWYQRSFGLDAPLTRLLQGLGVLAALVVACALLVKFREPLKRVRTATSTPMRGVSYGATLGALVVVSLAFKTDAWLRLGQALPYAVLAILAGYCVPLLSRSNGGKNGRYARTRACVILGVFAIGMLLKLGLRARFHHYGFTLAAPATLLCIGGLTRILPVLLRRRFGHVPGLRTLGRGIVHYVVLMCAVISLIVYEARDFPIGQRGDRMHVLSPERDSRTVPFHEALTFLDGRVEPGMHLLVMPEGVLLNYLLRTRPPVDVASLMPLELDVLGPERITHSLRNTTPEAVVLIERDMREYGLADFPPGGFSYAPLMAWIAFRYCVEGNFSMPTSNGDFQVSVLRPCPPGASGSAPVER
jgi:hypothetical protein